ncbi:MAG: hypothetical protein HY753_08305 [Nitrospirae bacterium]|nr:hypothetical protein [Nitrospirota bacterium]MBI4842730.1 hypothetical protein [Nitrospirota bacterium]
MKLTKRTHYNPCFWTACWNPDYYEYLKHNVKPIKKVRETPLFVLNVKADKILPCTAEKVFWENGLGLSTITAEESLDYCKRIFPEKCAELTQWYESNPGDLYLDFENVFTAIENSTAYKSLIEVVANEGLRTREDKVNLAMFIVMHKMRNHAIINAHLEMGYRIGKHRFEHFIWLKNEWGNCEILHSLVMPIVACQWIVYKTDTFSFPLNDSPIMSDNGKILFVLSPKLLVEIDIRINANPEVWKEKNYIPQFKMNEFRRKVIWHSFKEIVFHDERTLLEWKQSPEYKKRYALIKDLTSFNKVVIDKAGEEIWTLNAFAGIRSRE